ncbi:MAG: glycosyltransferase family 2 protein, partial [bacterium]
KPIVSGEKDFMMGSRISEAKTNMPLYKYVSNRFLSFVEELSFRLNLSEYHSGFRAYSRQVLEIIPFLKNSNDFVFDTQVLAQISLANFRAGEVNVPCRYFAEASEINFWRSTVYGVETLLVCLKLLLHKIGVKVFAEFCLK